MACLLSFLVLLSPDLTLAPLLAGEPLARAARPIDVATLPLVPHRPPRNAFAVPPPAVGTARLPSADATRFAIALEAARSYAGAYGVTFAAVRDGALVWAGSTGRERDGRTELTTDSTLVIGSITKTYVAAVVLQLVEEGRLDLDDSVRRYLPDMRGISRDVTIRELLDHTSGLADLFNDTTRRGLEEHPERAWTSAEVLATLHAPWYRPGEGWAYANTNYFLLGLIVEKLTDATLAEEVDRRFLAPMGLGATHLLSADDATSPLSPAWTTIFWASGAMTASATDLARWGDALYGPAILDRDTRAQMLQLNSNDYGFAVQRIELGGLSGYGHTGLLNTYTSLLLHLPTENLTIALLVNRSDVDLGGMLLVEPPTGPSLVELALGEQLPRADPAE